MAPKILFNYGHACRSGQQTPQLGETPTAAAAAAVAKKAQFSFKASGYLQFDEIPQKDKFLAKIAEFNAALSSSSPHVALRPIDLEAVTALFQVNSFNNIYDKSKINK